jgi:hypothetical protein
MGKRWIYAEHLHPRLDNTRFVVAGGDQNEKIIPSQGNRIK